MYPEPEKKSDTRFADKLVKVFTGKDGRKMPCKFEYVYRQTRLVYEYQTLSILDFTDEELDKSPNTETEGYYEVSEELRPL